MDSRQKASDNELNKENVKFGCLSVELNKENVKSSSDNSSDNRLV